MKTGCPESIPGSGEGEGPEVVINSHTFCLKKVGALFLLVGQ